MTDIELQALALYVHGQKLAMKSADEARLSNGCAVAHGDAFAEGEQKLAEELKARGVLP